jgi:glucose/mannose-6-phosphate isomerase
MNKLDDKNQVAKLDISHCYESITLLADQCEDVWIKASQFTIPRKYSDVASIIFTGMGGSSYGARIIKSLYIKNLPVPVEIINDYHLPKYADENTLVIAASYSGGTEETISCIKEALDKKCKLIGISSGGEMEKILSSRKLPVFVFDTKYNPSNQPRLGQGYMQMGQLAIFNSLKFINISNSQITSVTNLLKNNIQKLSLDNAVEKNPAKKLAEVFADKIVNLIGAEFLEGAVHAIRNPLHETGKHFANYFLVPELNHHLMEGLSHPLYNKEKLLFVLINSKLYSERIQKRMRLSYEVIEKNNIPVKEINLNSTSELEQVFELIQLGSFISFYLAMIHDVNPANIPWVDYFKSKLK